jgi:phosphate transport system protein
VNPDKAHTDRVYDTELRQLKDKLVRMAGLVEDMIARASSALADGDVELARKVRQVDAQVNTLEIETDEQCLLLLAKRQPLAYDLRMITLAMKMVTDLERVGDLAVNICERVVAMGAAPAPTLSQRLGKMAEIAQSMIRDAIDGFVQRDVVRARSVFGRDDSVDALYRELAVELQREMSKDPKFVDTGVHLQACAKFLERIGDHGTNLAELVIFLVEGRDVRHKAERFPQPLPKT